MVLDDANHSQIHVKNPTEEMIKLKTFQYSTIMSNILVQVVVPFTKYKTFMYRSILWAGPRPWDYILDVINRSLLVTFVK